MTSLIAYIVRRLILLTVVILGVTVLIFAITMMFSPEVRAFLYVRNVQQARPEVIRSVIKKYGLNDPFHIQYYTWLSQVVQGNLGWSHSGRQTVADAIRSRWPYTFEIVMFAAPIIIFLGIFLGVQSAVHRNSIIDHATRVFAIIGWSLPSFWLGILLLTIFYGQLKWLPPGPLSSEAQHFIHSASFIRYTGIDLFDGILNGQFWITIDALKHVILPVTVIVIIDVAGLIRIMRSSMLETLNKPYVTTAKAKGLNEKVVVNKHARRNALIPVITLSGMLVAGLLGGLVITETVFGFGGLGQWAANAALQIDIAAVLGYAILSAFLFVAANLIVDILYAYIDPRIRLE
ncbi:MAG: ABC transporter permease [Candidatus Bathyarchaeia archaeon]|nr:ABC transporter permease [Candidatus Bathyarchaeia archaeon]